MSGTWYLLPEQAGPSSHGHVHGPPAHGHIHSPPSHGHVHGPPTHGHVYDLPSHGHVYDLPSHGHVHGPPTHGRVHSPPSHGRIHSPPSHGRIHSPPSHGRIHSPPSHGHIHSPQSNVPGPYSHGAVPGAAGAMAGAMAGAHGMEGVGEAPLSSRMRDPSLGAVVRREGDSSSGDLTCRQARNNAEKARRDRVSSSINQMTAFVNVLKQSPKKIDKITILRVVANHVRLHKLSSMVFESREDGGLGAVPSALGEHIESLVLEDTKSVAFVVSSTNGKIVYVTKTVENVLGHTQVELFGQEFKRLVHEDDQDIIKAALQPLSSDGTPLKALEPASSDESSSDDTGTSTSMSSQDSPLPGRSTPSAAPPPPSESQKRSFKFRIQQRPVSRSDSPQYEEVNADGFLWVPGRVVATGTSAESSQGRRRRSTDDPEANSCLLLMMIKLVRETRGGLQALSIGMNRNEYLTRHMPNGCFLTTDFRISLVSGYLPEEVVGVDAFTYMHPEDAKWAHVALQYMLMHAEETGYSCYRLRSKTGDYIHLKTCGYLEKNDEGKIVSFICINSLVTEEEAAIAKAQMQKRFAPHFSSFQQPRESGVRIVELSDDELQHDRETIQAILPPYNVSATESSSLPPPSPELQPRPSSSSSFHGSVPGRESVLHMAGDVRRTQGRKRSSESELQPQKRVCSTSPGHTPTSPSSSLSPRSLTLRASSASPALPGPSALSPDLSSGLDLNSPGVLEDVMVDPYPAADVFPNVEWGRQGGPEDAAPAPLAVAAPDQDLLDLAHIEVPMDPYLAGDVTQGSIFLVEQINGIPISTHCPNPQETSSMTLQQTQIGNSLQVQGQQMLTIQTGLNQVPPNNPERHRLENELYLAKEEHIRQGKELHNLQEETRRANQQTYC